MTKAEPEQLTTAEYAAHVGTSAQVVRRWIRQGRLEGACTKDARGAYRINPAAADQLIGHSTAGDHQSSKAGDDGRVSVKQFAGMVGVSVAAVRQAIAGGRLDGCWTENAQGHYRILADRARQQWNPSAKVSKSVLRAGDQLDDLAGTDAVAERQRYEARLARTRWMEQTGQLVDVQVAKEQVAEAGQLLKARLLEIPDRLAPDLIRKRSAQVIATAIRGALLEVLEELASVELTPRPLAEDDEEEAA